jgi:multicomponent Na+:H+ antiporter subunit B
VSRRARVAVFLPSLAVFGALLVWALAGLPDFGHYVGPYGYLLNRVVVPERHMTNVVTAVVFDYRGFDTLGEEFILFGAVTGVVLLLRGNERPDPSKLRDAIDSDMVRVVGVLALGAALLVGLWIVAFGFVTPGGGFQGGVIVAGAALLVFLVSSLRDWEPFGDERALDPLEGIGAGGYVIVGLAALVSGLPFLTNLLGPGIPGTLQSGGTALFVNWAVALEVSAALLILFSEFLEEYIVPLAAESS